MMLKHFKLASRYYLSVGFNETRETIKCCFTDCIQRPPPSPATPPKNTPATLKCIYTFMSRFGLNVVYILLDTTFGY